MTYMDVCRLALAWGSVHWDMEVGGSHPTSTHSGNQLLARAARAPARASRPSALPSVGPASAAAAAAWCARCVSAAPDHAQTVRYKIVLEDGVSRLPCCRDEEEKADAPAPLASRRRAVQAVAHSQPGAGGGVASSAATVRCDAVSRQRRRRLASVRTPLQLTGVTCQERGLCKPRAVQHGPSKRGRGALRPTGLVITCHDELCRASRSLTSQPRAAVPSMQRLSSGWDTRQVRPQSRSESWQTFEI